PSCRSRSCAGGSRQRCRPAGRGRWAAPCRQAAGSAQPPRWWRAACVRSRPRENWVRSGAALSGQMPGSSHSQTSLSATARTSSPGPGPPAPLDRALRGQVPCSPTSDLTDGHGQSPACVCMHGRSSVIVQLSADLRHHLGAVESLLLVVDPENSRTSPPAVDSRCAGPESLPVLQLPTIPWQPPSRDPLTNRLTVDGDGHNEPFGLGPSMVPGTVLEVRGIGQVPTEWGVENDAAAESQRSE